MRVCDWFDYDYDYDYEYEHEYDYEHEHDERLITARTAAGKRTAGRW